MGIVILVSKFIIGFSIIALCLIGLIFVGAKIKERIKFNKKLKKGKK